VYFFELFEIYFIGIFPNLEYIDGTGDPGALSAIDVHIYGRL